jgi:hypothetical protein
MVRVDFLLFKSRNVFVRWSILINRVWSTQFALALQIHCSANISKQDFKIEVGIE